MFNRKKNSFHRIQVYIFLLSAALSPTLLFSGCSKQDDYPKTRDIDYTVVTGSEIPQELRKMIRERKENAFELSFSCEGELYIVKGYGKQISALPSMNFIFQITISYLTRNYMVLSKNQLLKPRVIRIL